MNMQTSFMTPPFGFALFYLRSVAPKEVKTSDIYWASVPFVAIQLVMVALIISFPALISVGVKTDMKEQIELNIDMSDGGMDDFTHTDFSFDGDTDSSEIKFDVNPGPGNR